MSIADKPIHPVTGPLFDKGDTALVNDNLLGGMTLLQHYAGLNWTQDEIDSVIGGTVESSAVFLGIAASDYHYQKHYALACSKARVILARALIAELEKVQP